MNPRFQKAALLIVPILALVTIYQNCGQGLSASNSGTVQSNGSPSPSPAPNPVPNPVPNPNPSASLLNQWSAITNMGAPVARSSHTAVWTGSRMLVWGGSIGGGTMTNTGGSYDPAANSWTAMSTTGAPVGRAYHRAVWTGTQMVVWGGATTATQSSVVTTNTGGVYNPATNTWTAMSTVGAPVARWYFNMAWTGSRVLVWGGNNDAINPALDSALYDPATNTWTQMPSGGPTLTPFSRSAVVGNKLVVWGGDQGVTGGVFNFATNAWEAMDFNGAPAPRYLPYAISTGTKALFFGGFNYNNTFTIFNNGGLYDPIAKTWQLISSVGAIPRDEQVNAHNAVFTGSELVVWGSETQTAPGSAVRSNSGGIYNIASNTWSQVSSTNAPAARIAHSTVWTGTEMIIYGGIDANSFLILGGHKLK